MQVHSWRWKRPEEARREGESWVVVEPEESEEFVPGESNIADIMTKSVHSVTAYRLHRDHMCHGLQGSVRECQFTSCDH